MCQKEQSEKSRLLDKEVIPVFGEIKFKYPKWVAYSILMVIILTHIYSVVSSLYVVNQYAYSAFMKARYPHRKSQSFNEDNSACARDTNSEAYKEQIVVQKVTTEWNIYCALAQNIPGILVNLNLATYSDVYGRKPFFLVPLVGTFLKNLFCTFGIYFEINMQYFIVFYFIEGCTGIWASTLSMAFCFIADTTEPGKTRSLIIGVIEVGVGIGALIATLFSGYTIKWCSGFMYPELISVVVVFTGIILIVAVLPESLHESRKREDVSIWGNLKRATECYRTDFSPSGKRWMFIILLFIFIMSAFSILGRPNVETIYQMNSPFCWNSVKIGWFGTLRNIAWSFGSMIVIKVFHICTTDEVIAMFGCITSAVSAILEGIASSDLVMYLGEYI